MLRLDEKIVIEAKTTWGGLRAIATLYQLASSGELSRQLEITDRPRFGWRGLLIDVARSFVSIAILTKERATSISNPRQPNLGRSVISSCLESSPEDAS